MKLSNPSPRIGINAMPMTGLKITQNIRQIMPKAPIAGLPVILRNRSAKGMTLSSVMVWKALGKTSVPNSRLVSVNISRETPPAPIKVPDSTMKIAACTKVRLGSRCVISPTQTRTPRKNQLKMSFEYHQLNSQFIPPAMMLVSKQARQPLTRAANNTKAVTA